MMGFLSDMGRLARQTKEMKKDYDPGQQSRDALEKMRQANSMLEAQTQGVTDGVPATASVVSVGATQGMLNMDPMLPVELLVTQPGMPPRPVTATMVVPMAYLPRVQPGQTLPVLVSASNPGAVTVNWAAIA